MLEQSLGSAPSKAAQMARALQDAVSLCRDRGARLTGRRLAVLELLWQARQPLGAYQLLSRLAALYGRKLAPPTIYRALEFLLGQGLIARIESRNAYVPCAHPERAHGCVFLVCDQCSSSFELEDPALEELIKGDARRLGFQLVRRVVELQGTCAHCQEPSSGSGIATQ